MNKIISVKPIPEYFSITWMLGSRCNYDCMYCPSEYHDTTSVPLDLATLKMSWKNIYEKSRRRNLPYKISFTGGEVTANKNFLPMVEWLRENYVEISMILVTTNGSASLNYYKKLSKLIEGLSFSTHSEHMDEQDFFNKAEVINSIMVRPEKSFHVNIMDEFWNSDRIALYKERLDRSDVSYSLNTIRYNQGTREFPIMKGNLNLV